MWRAMCVALAAFVVMFWNVENFFDPFDDPLKNDDEFTSAGERHWTWRRFETKRDGIVQTILCAGDVWGELPALVGLAEVENRLTVSQLVRETLLDELGYGYVHRESPDARGIDVALLYRKDRVRVVAVDSLRVPGVVTRDILYVRCREKPGADDAGERELHAFVVHLPSRRGGARSTDERRAAALSVLEAAVEKLQQDNPQARIVVMGDFNDTDVQVCGLQSAPHDTASSPVPTAPGTLRYHGRWEQIDHIFLSGSLPGCMRILAPPFLLEPDKAWLGVKPRRTYAGPRYNGGLSDHLPVILRIFP